MPVFTPNLVLTPWPRRVLWRLGICGVVLRLAVAALGADLATDGLPQKNPPITSLQEFWLLQPEARLQPQPFRIECDVTFYDPAWKSMWLQDATGGAYVLTGDQEFSVHSGQHVVVSGITQPPNRELTLANATFETLGAGVVKPTLIANGIDRSQLFSDRLVTVDALVENQTVNDTTHMHLDLSVEGKAVFAWVLLDPSKPAPRLINTLVRLNGVYNPKTTNKGDVSALEIMVGRPDYLTVTGTLANDQRFDLPHLPIASLVNAPSTTLVRVVGQVKGQAPGRYLRIRDATGQIDILTGQKSPCAVNAWVEAVGYPVIRGTEWQLASGLFRFLREPLQPELVSASNAETPALLIAAQVAELTPEEAARKYPVALTGVVTWSHPEAPFFFVQDASGGVCIQRGQDKSKVRPPGRNVEVHGTTKMGVYAPEVISSVTEKLGDLIPPEPLQVSLEHALTGVAEAQWVEMRGYLRHVSVDGLWRLLEIATPAGDFSAVLPATEDVTGLVGAVVRLQGVCKARADDRRKLTDIQLWVPDAAHVQVEEPAPADPFAVRRYALASLGRFGTGHSQYRRVLVEGVVLHHVPGYLVYIEEGNETLLVLSRDRSTLKPGDRIEAVGFVGWQGGRTTLREATFRIVGHDHEPEPLQVASPRGPMRELDGRLVQIQGQLVNSTRFEDKIRLTLRCDDTVVEAVLAAPVEHAAALNWEIGSQLSLTGVYELKFDQYRQPQAFQLTLRSQSDIVVLRTAPWLTASRVLGFTGALALGTALAVAWVVALRRRVRQQTKQIRVQIERETHLTAELQRASKLESLGLLAGGIAHDFNNLLTVVMGNLALIRLGSPLDQEQSTYAEAADKAILRARDLTQQLLTFAKGGAPIRAAVGLGEIVSEVAGFNLHGSKVRCKFDIATDLWPANVDKGQIGQVVQNLVINSVQAMPNGGLIRIGLTNVHIPEMLGQELAAGKYILMRIADNGAGIRPEDLNQIFDPYFSTKKHGSGLGLATVYSIIKKHNGRITVESDVGHGTTFQIWLPAADKAPSVVAPEQRDIVNLTGRVLLMDDEPEIQRIGTAMLRRLGLETHAVDDGAAAVREYAQARKNGHPYDLVILDLTVPGGMGGKQTMEELLRLDPQAKAIVTSGYSNDAVLANYRAHGFYGMVSKPYEFADFAHAIDLVLKGSKA